MSLDQGCGIGSALLETAFARFAAAGLREAQLAGDSGNTRGLRVYERAGNDAPFQTYVYERPVRASRVDVHVRRNARL